MTEKRFNSRVRVQLWNFYINSFVYNFYSINSLLVCTFFKLLALFFLNGTIRRQDHRRRKETWYSRKRKQMIMSPSLSCCRPSLFSETAPKGERNLAIARTRYVILFTRWYISLMKTAREISPKYTWESSLYAFMRPTCKFVWPSRCSIPSIKPRHDDECITIEKLTSSSSKNPTLKPGKSGAPCINQRTNQRVDLSGK